jgi:hypothetical protein
MRTVRVTTPAVMLTMLAGLAVVLGEALRHVASETAQPSAEAAVCLPT